MSRIVVPMLRGACAVFLLGLAVVLAVFVDWGAQAGTASASRPPGKPIAGPPAQRSVADLRSLPTAPRTSGGSMLFHSTHRLASGAAGSIANSGARDFGGGTLGFGRLDPSGYGAPAVITGFNGIDIN